MPHPNLSPPLHIEPHLTVWVEVDPSTIRLAIGALRTCGRTFAATAAEWDPAHRSAAKELELALGIAVGAL